jgi:hypothetical protein
VTETPRKLRLVVQSPQGVGWPAFSPDGHWLLYATCPGVCQAQVYLQPYPGPGPRQQVSVDGGYSPVWNANGREILFEVDSNDGTGTRLMAVDVSPGQTPALGTPRLLFSRKSLGACTPAGCLAETRDCQRFIVCEPLENDPPRKVSTEVRLVLGWLAELQAKVPSGL